MTLKSLKRLIARRLLNTDSLSAISLKDIDDENGSQQLSISCASYQFFKGINKSEIWIKIQKFMLMLEVR